MAIRIACIFFPFVALIVLIPFMLHEYRKYGSIPFSRWLIEYLFLFYMFCLYCLVILPLPDREDVVNRTGPIMNLIPFNYVREILVTTPVSESKVMNLFSIIMNRGWVEPILNVIMLVPFGMYAHYYWKKSWSVTLLLSFLLSLFFELTQLSGLYGIYPRPYRLFDVNDLIENGLGGLIGWLIAPLFTAKMPTRDQIDEKAYANSTAVTFTRRLLANLVDMALLAILTTVINIVTHTSYVLLINGIVMFIVPLLFMGYTIGKWIVRIRLYDDGKHVYWLRLLVRQFIAWVIIYGCIFINNDYLIQLINNSGYGFIRNLIGLVLFIWLVIDAFQSRKREDKHFYYEELLHIYNQNMVVHN